MADIELVINIPEDTFQYYVRLANKGEQLNNLESIILDGTPLPKGHGKLIDADKLKKEIYVIDVYSEESVRQQISDAPTLIEADTESEDKEW